MTLLRWQRPELAQGSPFRHLSTLRDEIDRLFESPLSALTQSSNQFLSGWMPAVDLYEDKDNLHLKAELPGMNKNDIEISIHEGVLTISGERKLDEKYREAEVYRSERTLGRFQRTLTLPAQISADKVKAYYQDGLLTVLLPKAEESKPKQIEIKAS
ncbi:MAG: Hsp20/alpha crystallin family protein [Verrucomicrobia bacterium]|nr:Hsp20/alpha crystallin family protein [Verrucomicrobiota bacterium]